MEYLLHTILIVQLLHVFTSERCSQRHEKWFCPKRHEPSWVFPLEDGSWWRNDWIQKVSVSAVEVVMNFSCGISYVTEIFGFSVFCLRFSAACCLLAVEIVFCSGRNSLYWCVSRLHWFDLFKNNLLYRDMKSLRCSHFYISRWWQKSNSDFTF